MNSKALVNHCFEAKFPMGLYTFNLVDKLAAVAKVRRQWYPLVYFLNKI